MFQRKILSIRKFLLFVNCFGMLFLSPSSATAFTVPERLEFDLRWAGIKAGTATLELKEDKNTISIVSTARSVDWVSLFYPVRDRVEAELIKKHASSFIVESLRYRVKLREGRHRRDKEVMFDHEKRTATYIDHRKDKRRYIDIGPGTLDPLSSFYYVRTQDIEVGKSVFVDIFDSKRMWNVEVKVLRKEKVRTVLGEFDTVVIKPLMKSEGLFNRKGDMHIWLTDDEKHIPVKMKTKVVVGSVIATLVGGTY